LDNNLVIFHSSLIQSTFNFVIIVVESWFIFIQ
jgi:hypothetical protein